LRRIARPFASCATDDDQADSDLDSDGELATLLADSMPEHPAEDTAPVEAVERTTHCTRHRFLHIANWSFVPPLSCVNGVCSNGCWGGERRTSGFACDYDASLPGYIKVRDGGGTFAAYNEIKPLNPHDAAAVAACHTRSAARVKTYTVWNGVGFDNEGIPASVSFAELFGTQLEAQPHFWTWYANQRGGFAPMGNISPDTGISYAGVKNMTARLCSATRDAWLGLYFYDGKSSGGPGMADWKREAIIRGMNYCTTH